MIERLGSGNTQSFFLLPPPPPQAEVEEEEREWATSRYSPLIAFTSRTSRRGSVGISEKSRNSSPFLWSRKHHDREVQAYE